MQVANMGNYAHGNQPAQHMIYLYDWTNEAWKAQKHIREVMDKLYNPNPDGYCGDEDNGQTSAWYVFSALGFYPVCPGSDEYAIGTPYFPEAQILLENGKTLTIKAQNADGKPGRPETYIKTMSVNGKEHTSNFLNYRELIKGGEIVYTMSNNPAK